MSQSLQTLAYIQVIENLLTNVRYPESEEENTLLSDFIATQVLLTHSFGMQSLASLWNVDVNNRVTRRRTLIKSLDVSFHRHYKQLCESFKKARNVFLPMVPEMCAFSVPSIQNLVYLYNQKSEMLQKSLYRSDLKK